MPAAKDVAPAEHLRDDSKINPIGDARQAEGRNPMGLLFIAIFALASAFVRRRQQRDLLSPFGLVLVFIGFVYVTSGLNGPVNH